MSSRPHSVEKNIADINENDYLVRIIGIVIDVGKDYLVVDDGTGKIEIFFKEDLSDEIKIGETVKVIGKVYYSPENIKINAKCIQILKNFNIKLYKQAKEIIKKVMENG